MDKFGSKEFCVCFWCMVYILASILLLVLGLDKGGEEHVGAVFYTGVGMTGVFVLGVIFYMIWKLCKMGCNRCKGFGTKSIHSESGFGIIKDDTIAIDNRKNDGMFTLKPVTYVIKILQNRIFSKTDKVTGDICESVIVVDV